MNKEATLKYKLIDILAEYDVFMNITNPIIASTTASEFIDKILKLISKEIKKNRPEERKLGGYDERTINFKLQYIVGYNQALSEYDKIIADTLK